MSEPVMSKPVVFLSYATEDLIFARRLYEDLKRKGIDVWFYEEHMGAAQNLKETMQRAIEESRYFLALLSKSYNKKVGYASFELFLAIEQSKFYPLDVPYLIPVRLDDSNPSHERLRGIKWVDLFDDWEAGIDEIVRVVNPSADQVISPVLRTNGLYVAEIESGPYRFYNLKFFADGEVVAVSSDLSPDELAPHMTPTSRYMAVGKYTVRETRIEFLTKGALGAVDYRGYLTLKGMVLDKNSQINHHRDVVEYSFKPVADLSEETDVP